MCSSFISAYANLPNSSCNFSKHRSLFLQTLHQSSMLSSVTPLYFFKLKHYIPWSKEPIKEQIFKIFECSSQNMSNFLCQFSKYKSVFLQILHKSLVSQKITSLYCFRLNIIYFGHKKPIKKQFFKSFSCQFKNNKSIPIQILHHSSLSRDISPL